jgi:hypothetical protein
MLTVAFAAIPYFLVSHTKAKTAAMSTTARIDQAKMRAAHKNLNPDMANGTGIYVYKASDGKGKAVVSRSGQIVRVKIVKGGKHSVSPVSFEAHPVNKVKEAKPNET